ncbi:MAG: flagellar protein FliT [Clostridium sp.]|nr:flagellar protein FliT [Clostridium sp.]
MIDKILDDYKSITEKAIKNIEDDQELIKLMDEREELIKLLFAEDNDREKVKALYLEKDLLSLDKKLKLSIDKERLKVKEEIKNIHKIKNANNAYEKNRRINNFFSTKI